MSYRPSKFAKYYELDSNDIVVTVLTDSMELYGTRIQEYRDQYGTFTTDDAAVAFGHSLLGAGPDNMLELSYPERTPCTQPEVLHLG